MRLEREKKKTGGLISDETLLRIIALEFNVDIRQGGALTPTLSVRHLVAGLSDVTVVGRVVAVFPPKVFSGNRSGKVASLLIADNSGLLRVVFWNDQTTMIDSGGIRSGHVVRFSHGYTKEDRRGRVELHMGEKSEVEVNPPDVRAEDYPTISKFTTKIKEISHVSRSKRVNVSGIVRSVFSPSVFERQNSSSGKVMRFIVADETGEMSIVAWNEKADELEKMLKEGAWLQIVNASVKKAANGGLEVHVNSEAYVELLEPEEEFLKIASLKEGMNHVNVEGEVATKPLIREVKTLKGDVVKLAVSELADETGRIWFSAWRKHADAVKKLSTGDKIVVKNAYVKRGFSEQLEISTRATTSITLPREKKD